MTDDKTVIRTQPVLYAIKNFATGEVFNISKNTTVGRRVGSDVELHEGHVSLDHATLKVTGVALVLKDENSLNGTYLNGSRISEVVLRPNDVVKFDIHEFMVIALANETSASSVAETLVISGAKADEIADTFISHRSEDPLLKDTLIPDTLIVNDLVGDKMADTRVSKQAQNAPEDTVVLQRSPVSNMAAMDTDILPSLDDQRDVSLVDNSETLIINSSDTHILRDAAAILEQSAEHFAETTYLYGYHPLIAEAEYALDKNQILIGKSPLADISIKDSSISSRHAELTWDEDCWVIEDLGSTNGTFINGEFLSEATVLMPGDLIQIGLIQIVFAQPEPHAYETPETNKIKWYLTGVAILALIAGAAYWLVTRS